MEATLLAISGAFILILLGIIGFFLKSFNNNVLRLNDSSMSLEKASIELSTTVKYMQGNCNLRHQNIDKRLDAHANEIKIHTKEIAAIKSKIS